MVADSELEQTALAPSYPAAAAAAATGAAPRARSSRSPGERLGETAVALSDEGEPRWVAVLSTASPTSTTTSP